MPTVTFCCCCSCGAKGWNTTRWQHEAFSLTAMAAFFVRRHVPLMQKCGTCRVEWSSLSPLMCWVCCRRKKERRMSSVVCISAAFTIERSIEPCMLASEGSPQDIRAHARFLRCPHLSEDQWVCAVSPHMEHSGLASSRLPPRTESHPQHDTNKIVGCWLPSKCAWCFRRTDAMECPGVGVFCLSSSLTILRSRWRRADHLCLGV